MDTRRSARTSSAFHGTWPEDGHFAADDGSMSYTDALPDTDPRAVFAATARTTADLIATVRADELARPTPCQDMDVQGLLGHLVMVLDRVAALGHGTNPMALPDTVAHGASEWPAAWAEGTDRALAAWQDDAVLERRMVLPWAEGPGSQMLASYVAELTVHTWDLATAVGRPAAYDDRAVAVSWAAYQASLPAGDRQARFDEVRAQMPPEFQAGPPPFLNAAAAPADAPLIDRVVAWTGRNP